MSDDRIPRSLSDVRHDATRAQIITVAERLFIERGLKNTSMSDVAKAVGLGRPALYYYFSSKDELADATVSAVAGRFRVFDNVPTTATLAEGISYVVTRLVDLVAEANTDIRFLLSAILEQADEPPEAQLVRAGLDGFRNAARRVIHHGQDTGEVHPHIDPAEAADDLFSRMLGIELMWLVDPTYDPRKAAKRLETKFLAELAQP